MANYSFLLAALCFLSGALNEPKFQAQVLDDNVAIGYGLAIGDVDGDRKPDILLADKKQFVWFRNGDWKRFVMVEKLTESDNVCIAARDARAKWKQWTIDESMHLTHNLDVVDQGESELLYIGGKEGVKVFSVKEGKWSPFPAGEWAVQGHSFGEIRASGARKGEAFIAGIEPMHGNQLTVYTPDGLNRTVLTSELNQGHALATIDLLGLGNN